MSNLVKHYLTSALWTTVNTFTAGAVLQTFLMESGFSEELTNIVTSCGQIITLAAMLLYSPVADRVRSVIHATARTYLLYIPLILVLVSICLYGSMPWLFMILLFVSLASYNIASGLHSSLSYKLPFVTLDMHHYGRITSIGGILTGVIGLLLSLVLTWLQNTLGYSTAMTGLFILCLPLTICVYLLVRTMKFVADAPVTVQKNSKPINYFRFKPFAQLIMANFMRGFGTGILNIVVTIGYFCGCIDTDSAAIIVVISNFTTFLGSGLYSVTTGRIPEKAIILFASVGVALSAPVMLIGNNTLVFLIAYGFATTFWTIVNYSIPVAVVQIADFSVMGQYSSGRLLLHTLGGSLAGFVCIPLMRLVGSIPVMVLTGICFLICGVSYFVYMKKNNLR